MSRVDVANMVEIKIKFTMSDGIKLSGCLNHVPNSKRTTVIKCDPYRNMPGELGYINDKFARQCFLKMGFNYLVVDVRGTGDSEGVALDEYTPQEQQDTLAIIKQVVQQPWSNAKVILYGISYSACSNLRSLVKIFNEADVDVDNYSLAKNTQKLVVGAILCHVSYDNCDNDIHWNGGVLPVSDCLQYVYAMTACNMLPNSYNNNLEQDRTQVKPWITNWITNKPDTKYWKDKSISISNFRKITTPILLIGGFSDLYCESVIKLSNWLPNNLTIVGKLGHALPMNFCEIIKHWLNNWLSNKLTDSKQTIYARVEDYDIKTSVNGTTWITDINQNRYYHDSWTGSYRVANVITLGPFYRFTPRPVGFYGSDGISNVNNKHNLNFFTGRLPKPAIIFGQPLISISVKQPPKDFYLVAWIFELGSDRLLSLGVQRMISTSSTLTSTPTLTDDDNKDNNSNKARLNITCSPMSSFNLCEFKIVVSMSCLPMLMPQTKNEFINIESVDYFFPMAECKHITTKLFAIKTTSSLLAGILPEDESQELNAYNHIKEFINIDVKTHKQIYKVVSKEEKDNYTEGFELTSSIKRTEFKFEEVYYNANKDYKVETVSTFSNNSNNINSNALTSQLNIERTIVDKGHLQKPPAIKIDFEL